jgi:hypothetical protein
MNRCVLFTSVRSNGESWCDENRVHWSGEQGNATEAMQTFCSLTTDGINATYNRKCFLHQFAQMENHVAMRTECIGLVRRAMQWRQFKRFVLSRLMTGKCHFCSISGISR